MMDLNAKLTSIKSLIFNEDQYVKDRFSLNGSIMINVPHRKTSVSDIIHPYQNGNKD